MTQAQRLALQNFKHDVTLFIEGIPYVFGTRTGTEHPMTDLDGNTLTQIGATAAKSAIVRESIEVSGGALNWETLIQEPGNISFEIAASSTWNQYFMRRLPESFRHIEPIAYGDSVVYYDGYVVSDAASRNGSLLYCGRESMLITSVDTGAWEFTVTRAYADLPGTQSRHDIGNACYWSPPQWIGRRCEVRFWLGDTTQRVVYGVIQSSPEYDSSKSTWKIQAKDTMSMLDRKIAVGFTGGECTAGIMVAATNNNPALEIRPSPEWVDEIGDDTAEEAGHILIQDSEDNAAIATIIAFAGSGERVIVYVRDSGDVNLQMITKAKRCYLFKGYPMRALLTVLMSKAGNNSQSVTISGSDRAIGDRLFGQVLDASAAEDQAIQYGNEKRFGAAINKIFLDVWSGLSTSDLAEAVRTFVPGFCYALGLNGEEDLIGLMSEVAHLNAGFFYMNNKGQISFRKFRADVPGQTPSGLNSYVITDDDIGVSGTSWVSLDDESECVATQTIECNWEPVQGKFLGKFNLINTRVHEAYREKANNIKSSRRGLYVRMPGTPQKFTAGLSPGFVDREVFRTQMERVTQQRDNGLRKYNLRLPWKYSQIQPGDRAVITTRNLIDFAGNGSSLNAFTVMPLKVSLDVLGGFIDVECVEVSVGLVLPPVLEVLSYDSGTKTITLKTGVGLEWDESDNTAPAKYIDGSGGSYSSLIGYLGLLDESSSPPYSTRLSLDVASITATTIVLNSTPSVYGSIPLTLVDPAAGDLIIVRPLSASTASEVARANFYSQGFLDFAWAHLDVAETNPVNPVNGPPRYGQPATDDDGNEFVPVSEWF